MDGALHQVQLTALQLECVKPCVVSSTLAIQVRLVYLALVLVHAAASPWSKPDLKHLLTYQLARGVVHTAQCSAVPEP